VTDEAKDGSVGSREPRIALARKLTVVAWILTIVVWGLVGAMRQFKVELPAGIELTFLPLVHAILNSLVAVFLLAALGAIRRKNVDRISSVLRCVSHYNGRNKVWRNRHSSHCLLCSTDKPHRAGCNQSAIYPADLDIRLYGTGRETSTIGEVGVSGVVICGDFWADLLSDAAPLLLKRANAAEFEIKKLSPACRVTDKI
jgi:hypothetical protein